MHSHRACRPTTIIPSRTPHRPASVDGERVGRLLHLKTHRPATVARPIDSRPGKSREPSMGAIPTVARSPGIHGRGELLEDLAHAADPTASPTVLAVFGFTNLKQQLETMLDADGDKLIGGIAERLTETAQRHAALYQPRRGEFCALFPGTLAATSPVLERAEARINRETRRLEITAVTGTVELPKEAQSARSALALASSRQGPVGPALRPNRRQSVYALISNALGKPRELRKTA